MAPPVPLLLTVTTLVSFAVDTLSQEPETLTTLLLLLSLGIGIDFLWKRVRSGRATTSVPSTPSQS